MESAGLVRWPVSKRQHALRQERPLVVLQKVLETGCTSFVGADVKKEFSGAHGGKHNEKVSELADPESPEAFLLSLNNVAFSFDNANCMTCTPAGGLFPRGYSSRRLLHT
jgi:hypothetical protein